YLIRFFAIRSRNRKDRKSQWEGGSISKGSCKTSGT
ncbi:hypothetical protein A2U01_0077796, partial [Trifolium medium]|nr:hypothetical protein [Trifolium medium]